MAHPRLVPSSHAVTPLPLPRVEADTVVRTRFVPPKLRPHLLHRPRLDAALARVTEYPLTLVKAEAGYGKTTAVADFVSRAPYAHVWYNVGDTEADPHIFLRHLIEALRTIHPDVGTRALARLAADRRSPRLWSAAVDALSNDLLDRLDATTVLVLDDYDRVNTAEVNAVTERLVETMPPLLHLIITARTTPSLRGRARWRASGEMLEVTRADLAFTAGEIVSLFDGRLAHPLSDDAARAVAVETEGWAIALQMLTDGLRGTEPDALDNLLRRIPGPAELLFDYLAEEVFLRQTPDVRRFLGESACLRRLDPEACDHTLEVQDAAETLRFLEKSSLFVTRDGAFRYHHLFADFLRRRSGVRPERRVALHRRAAGFYAARGEDEEAVYHLLAAGDPRAAADALARIAGPMAASGRHQALGGWLDQIPSAVLDRSPELLVARGETCRLAGRFADAVPAYERARERFQALGDAAGAVRALRGHALLYLDTVQPARAEPLLREAARMTRRGDRAERVALYPLLAENALNAGELRRAARLFAVAQRTTSRCADDSHPFDARLLLRTGRFAEARQLMEASLRADAAPLATRPRAPRSHREAAALLAFTDAMTGQAASARRHAEASLEVGRVLASPVVECISLARLGLGWLSGHDYDATRARAHCQEALRAGERIGVARVQVEPLLGLTILHGLDGARDDAEAAARRAVAIVDDAGDRYLRGIVWLAGGAALALCNDVGAEGWLRQAEQSGTACGDRFTPTLAALWLAIHYSRAARTADARESFAQALDEARRHDYGFVFDGTALLAPKDVALWRGMLRRAQEHATVGDYARAIARRIEPSTAEALGPEPRAHSREPQFTDSLASAPLYIQTFGPFRVWRLGQEIERGAWAREKALHLLQLLVCNRGRVLHREQVIEALWPDSSPSTAATGLRVALSALRSALEPGRESGGDGQFVRREGEGLRLAMEAGVRVDADEFSRQLKAARLCETADVDRAIALHESALALYRGEFLGENRYAGWAEDERQRRRREYLASVERLAARLLAVEEYERAARWAETLLQHDPLWEAAYAVLMEAYWRQGNRALAVRAYDRCRKRLRVSLGVEPSAKTRALLERIAQPEEGAR